MFCGKCGTQNENGAMFCQSCGAKLETVPMQTAPVGAAPEVNEETSTGSDKFKSLLANKKLLIAIGGGVVAIILAIVLFFGGKGGPEDAVDEFFKAAAKKDAEKIIDLWIPESYQHEFFQEMEDEIGKGQDDFTEYLEESLGDFFDYMEDFEWKIKNVEKLGKLDELEGEVSFESLDDFRDSLEDVYEEYGMDVKKVEEAYAVEVKATYNVDGEKESGTEIDILYKYNDKWYVYNGYGFIF